MPKAQRGRNIRRFGWLLPISVVAGTGTATAQPAGTGISDIIVTAQKREENLQDTPISIAVLGSADLEKQGITNLTDLSSGLVPSLRVVPTAGRNSAMMVTMRGIAPGDPMEIARDATTGIYLDGVYLGRTQGLGTEMLDLERIEVLRGPQGTLFGRNAVGGAINMISKRPTGELGLDLTAGASNFNGFRTKAHLNLPQFAGISIKVDGVWSKRDGWTKNSLQDASDWGAYNRRGAHVGVLWEPADNLEFLYSYDISRDASTTSYAHMDMLLPGAPPLPPMFSVERHRVRHGRAGVPLEPGIGKVQGHGLHAEWGVNDNITLRSITSYRKMSQTQYDNSAVLLIPYRPFGVFGRLSYAEVHQNQFSEEIQLLGDFENFNFVIGGFYYRENVDNLAHSAFTALFNGDGTDYQLLPVNLGGPTYPERSSYVRSRSKALFGQATYTPPVLDERLHLTASLRWTKDHKYGAMDRTGGAPAYIPFDFSSSRVDPAFILAFDWTEAINSYVKWGRAYRAGGANSRSTTFRTFDDEQVSTWELGLKTELLERRLRLNLAAYHTRYSDRQVDFPNPANPSNYETLNAPGKTTIKGLELDIQAVPADGLTISASYAYTDWQGVDDINPFTGLLQHGVVNMSPNHSFSTSVDYTIPLWQDMSLVMHVDTIHSGSLYTGGGSAPKTGAYDLLNARVTLQDIAIGTGGLRTSLSLWGKNLTNAAYQQFRVSYGGPGLANTTNAIFNEPRTFGIEARIAF